MSQSPGQDESSSEATVALEERAPPDSTTLDTVASAPKRPAALGTASRDETPPSLGSFTTGSRTHPGAEVSVKQANTLRYYHLSLWGAPLILSGFGGTMTYGGPAGVIMYFHICLVISTLTNIWTILVLRAATKDPEYNTQPAIVTAWIVHTFSMSAMNLYFGVFSPAPMLMILVIFFTSSSFDRPVALLTYAGFAGGHLILSVPISMGWVVDPGAINTGDDYNSIQLLTAVGMIQFSCCISYALGRSAHRAVLQKMSEMEVAVRAVAQREALLVEARQDLEAALQGGTGRFTNQELGSYVIGDLIGRGGMGEVYRGTHKETKEPAAVKLISRAGLKDGNQVRRFLRELELAAKVQAPNVVKVLEVGDESAPFPYLAMELLDGEDLAAVLRRRKQLPSPEVLELVEHIGRGVDAANKAGIVHRDLKPHNIFGATLGQDQVIWKVLDFGVSKQEDGSGTLTRGHLVGTPVYMAPEQAAGRDVDHRADLYSIAAIAYRALTGRQPFRSSELPALLHKVVYSMPVCPCDLVEGLPDSVNDFFVVAMAKSPEKRFQSADELTTALGEALEDRLPAKVAERAAKLSADKAWRRE